MKCSSCGREVAPDAAWCDNCGVFLERSAAAADLTAPLPVTDAEPVAPAPTGPLEAAGARPCVDSAWCPTPEVLPGQATCVLGHPALQDAVLSGPPAAVVLPDGTRVALVPGRPLELGRRSPDPTVAAVLARFDTVSKRQAVVALEGAVVRVSHVGRTNPTWANGHQVRESVVLPLPVELWFGQSVRLSVEGGA